jgi:hypothetical protein
VVVAIDSLIIPKFSNQLANSVTNTAPSINSGKAMFILWQNLLIAAFWEYENQSQYPLISLINRFDQIDEQMSNCLI